MFVCVARGRRNRGHLSEWFPLYSSHLTLEWHALVVGRPRRSLCCAQNFICSRYRVHMRHTSFCHIQVFHCVHQGLHYWWKRDRNDGCEMEKVSLFSSDSDIVSQNSHTMWLLFCETSTRRWLMVAPPSLCIFVSTPIVLYCLQIKTTDCCLYHAVCSSHASYISHTLRLKNDFQCSVIQHRLRILFMTSV